MSLKDWATLIGLALQFPKEISNLVKLFQETPSEEKAKLVERIQKEVDAAKKGERPKWD